MLDFTVDEYRLGSYNFSLDRKALLMLACWPVELMGMDYQ